MAEYGFRMYDAGMCRCPIGGYKPDPATKGGSPYDFVSDKPIKIDSLPKKDGSPYKKEEKYLP